MVLLTIPVPLLEIEIVYAKHTSSGSDGDSIESGQQTGFTIANWK